MVVGALANEGGLRRSDFGKITIGLEHTIVELPSDLPEAVFDSLSATRISGKLIGIEPDSGPPARRSNAGPRKKSYAKGGNAGGRSGGSGGNKRKPRHSQSRPKG